MDSCLSLSSASFSLLINGNHSSWFFGSRRVRQGDPISSLLFLLTSQTLSAILNKALFLNLVPGFNKNLPRDFNHFIFVDDLILVTKASRKTARNCLLYLDLYHSLTGQKPSLQKSAIFLPS